MHLHRPCDSISPREERTLALAAQLGLYRTRHARRDRGERQRRDRLDTIRGGGRGCPTQRGPPTPRQALPLTFELALVEFVFLTLALAPNTWWLWVGVALLLATVVLTNVGPILVVPLFYKLTPLPDGEVKARLLALADRARTRVRGVYSMNLSVRTKAANAMVMGLGNTRRIIVGDTLLNTFTPDEIEVVMAHELGHQVHRDIPKLILVQSSVTLGGLYLVNVALHAVVGATPRFVGVADVATMPLLAALAGIFGVITLPLNNTFSRWVERQADAYALQSTHKTAAFIDAMTRL